MKIFKTLGLVLAFISFLAIFIFIYLNRGLSYEIKPATFNCLTLENGNFAAFDSISPTHIFGIGLAYAQHINETASEFDPEGDPPVFKKETSSLMMNGGKVNIPSQSDLESAVELLEPGIRQKINASGLSIPALLDYEAEMGFVLLEDISARELVQEGFVPKIGFFVANDLSARSIAVLGEGQPNRYDYWGVSKSFEGFTPITSQFWIPNNIEADAIPCLRLRTTVNGEVRQDQMTSDLIYTPLEMLRAVNRRFPTATLQKGDLVLTGTPGGVAMSAPRWLVRMAGILGLDRFDKLKSLSSEDNVSKYLKISDVVNVHAEGLGKVEVEITNEQ